MMYRVEKVVPVEPMKIQILFQNGIEKQYDIRQLCNQFPQFLVLQTNNALYSQVKVDAGGAGISWNDDLDLDAEELWENGVLV